MNFLRFPIEESLIKYYYEIEKFQTGDTVPLTCRARNYEPNTIWMGQFGIKMSISWAKQFQW